jgi:uncharacterized protein (TIGR00730 family)
MLSEEKRSELDELASRVLDQLDDVPNDDLVHRLLASVLRMSSDNRRADLKIAAATLEEMEHSFDVLEKYYHRRKVSIFGSSRSTEDSAIYGQARLFSERMAEQDFMVITGAGPGVMAAGNEGAGRENSFGLGIRLPFEAGANRHIAGDIKDITFKYFFTRKLAFLKDSHAVVCCPGGFGTHDEGFETLTLIQTGKAQLMPVVCLAPEGNPFWENWDQYVRDTLLAQGMISPADLNLYKITHCVDEAVEEVCHFYRRYHSYRFLGNKIVVRLTQPVSPDELEHLNLEYSDLLEDGQFECCESPHGERFDQSLESMPALTFTFQWGRYGRLREMINWLNDCELECPTVAPEHGEGGRLPVEFDDLNGR